MAGLFLFGGGESKEMVAMQSGGCFAKRCCFAKRGALSKPVAALPSPTFPNNANLTNEKNVNRIIYYQIVLKFDSSI